MRITKPYHSLIRKISFVGIIFILCSCNSARKNDKVEQSIESETALIDEVIYPKSINFKIPPPIELFLFLHDSDADYMHDVLHHPLRYKDYFITDKRAINFGIYTADLAYATVFGNTQDALLYFKAAKELATALGLHEGYGKEIALRIDDNLQDIDSLMSIAADSYDNSITYLEDQGLSDVVCLILAGGWIESLYLSTQSVSSLDMNSPVIERIADQQILLENLLLYLDANKGKANVSKLIDDLLEIQEAYDELYANAEGVIITKKQLVAVSNKVSDIRNDFISIN